MSGDDSAADDQSQPAEGRADGDTQRTVGARGEQAVRRELRTAVRSAFEAELTAVARAATAVSESWDGTATTDRTAAVDRLAERLRANGTAERLVGVVRTVADTLDTQLPAEPVAEPPYYVVTGEGPMVRVSLPELDRRVLVTVQVFRVESGGQSARYRRLADAPQVRVSLETT